MRDKILNFLESEEFVKDCRDVQSYLQGLMDANHNYNMRDKLEFLDKLQNASNELRCVKQQQQNEQVIQQQVNQQEYAKYPGNTSNNTHPNEQLQENHFLNQDIETKFDNVPEINSSLTRPESSPGSLSLPQGPPLNPPNIEVHKTDINPLPPKSKKWGFL